MKTHGTLKLHRADGTGFLQRHAWDIRATPDVAIRLKRMFPRAQPQRTGGIWLSDTPEVCRDLEWVMDRWPLKMTKTDRAHLVEHANRHREQEETVLRILDGGQAHLEFIEPARPARDYQLVAADLALTTGRLLLADELGLGKTMSGLLVLRDPEALPALIVCPTHLPRQWEDELKKTLPWLRSHVIRKATPYDIRARRDMHGHDPDVLIVNYHKIHGWADHLAGKIQTVIFDEAQELRRADSDKYKAAARIADQAQYRVGLTATPVYNYAGEIHNVLSVIAPDALGDRSEFAREWAGGMYWHDKLKVADPGALGTYLRDQGIMLRRTRRQVGRELPDVIRVPHTVDHDQKVHDKLMEGALDLAELIVSGDRKERFTASGDLDWKMRHATGVAKAPYVAEFVRMLLEAERKVVLFGWHRDVYEIWLDRLSDLNPVLYTGSESPAQKAAALERFLHQDGDEPADDEARVFIMSLRSGAGLNGLQNVTSTAVFGELDWSPGMHDQCIGRLHRDGQAGNVLAYFLVSDVGADPVMAEVLNVKRQQAEPIQDPDREAFTPVDVSDRVKRLAESILSNRRRAA